MEADPSKMEKETVTGQLEKMTVDEGLDQDPQEGSDKEDQDQAENREQATVADNIPVIFPQRRSHDDRQEINEPGRYSFTVCDMMNLKRFLVIGSESSTYCTTAEKLKMPQHGCVHRLIQNNNGGEVLKVLEDISVDGRVSKENPILMSLAICATCSKPEVRKAAYEKVATICNIPTKLFTFIEYCQEKINENRSSNPPKPQPNGKRPRTKEKEPTDEERAGPSSAKRQKSDAKLNEPFKKVNKKPKKSSGWGRMRRKGVASFYTDKEKTADRLLYLLSKYKQRSNWSHRQVLGYSHPKLNDEDKDMKKAKNLVLAYTTRGYETFKEHTQDYRGVNGELNLAGVSQATSRILCYIDTLHRIGQLDSQKTEHEKKLLWYMSKYGVRPEREEFATQYTLRGSCEEQLSDNPEGRRYAYQLVREHIPTGFLKSVKVWEALLEDMPMTAMIRDLGRMSCLGLFGSDNTNNKNVKIVCEALENITRLHEARVHPMKILIALHTYQQERGHKGCLKWRKNEAICNSLDKAFYLSFKQPKAAELIKTNKKYMLCLNMGGSSTWPGCYGCKMITPAMASVAMALITWNIEEHVEIMGFGEKIESLKPSLNKNMTIEEALEKTRGINLGDSDCSLPIVHAMESNKDIDVFIVYTDSAPSAGHPNPTEALKQYNKAMNKNAKLIVCAMQSNEFTIADPNNPNMLDICGFDTSVPDVISSFARGELSEKCNVCEECKRIEVGMQS